MPTHLCEITVATGKAYTAQAFSPQLTEGIRRTVHYCLTPTGSSLKRTEERLLISAQTLSECYSGIIMSFFLFVKTFVRKPEIYL